MGTERHVETAKRILGGLYPTTTGTCDRGWGDYTAEHFVDAMVRAMDQRIAAALSTAGTEGDVLRVAHAEADRQVRRLDVALAAEKAAHAETRARLESAEKALRSMNAHWPDGWGGEALAHFAKYPGSEC